MITSDYHIIAPETASLDWTQCRLLLELNRHFFHYTILSGEHTVVALKYYRLTPSPERGVVELLEDIISGDELLRKEIPVTTVVYNMPENHLVPAEFYSEALNRDFITLIHGDLVKGHIVSEQIKDTAICNVYSVDDKLHQFLQRKFKPAQFRHFYSLWIEWTQRQTNNTQECIQAMFYPNELLVMVVKNGDVQLVQSFSYETSEDAVFHLLNIYQQNAFSVNELVLKVSGMIAIDSAMYDELLKYFMFVETVLPPAGLNLAPDFDQFPPHFFSPILKMAVCV